MWHVEMQVKCDPCKYAKGKNKICQEQNATVKVHRLVENYESSEYDTDSSQQNTVHQWSFNGVIVFTGYFHFEHF